MTKGSVTEALVGVDHRIHDAEGLAVGLPRLVVAAERVAATVMHGVHGCRRAGQGDTFWQFRPYQPGDPTHRIDWHQSGKSQRIFIREREWEAAQAVYVFRDGSPSMHYRSTHHQPVKVERAELLALALMTLLVNGGERVALLGKQMTPTASRRGLRRLAISLTREGVHEPSIPQIVSLPRHARVVLFSDFLAPLADLDAFIRHLAGFGVHGHLVQILDPAEETLPFHGRTLFEGLEEEGQTLISRVEVIRRDYGTALTAQMEGLRDIARSVGWTLVHHRTDHPAEPVLLSLYLAMSELPAT